MGIISLADEGNESAEKELDRWEEIYDEEFAKLSFQVSEETKKNVERIMKNGIGY